MCWHIDDAVTEPIGTVAAKNSHWPGSVHLEEHLRRSHPEQGGDPSIPLGATDCSVHPGTRGFAFLLSGT